MVETRLHGLTARDPFQISANIARTRVSTARPIRSRHNPFDDAAKRISDIVLASVLLLAFFPLLLAIALLVALDGGPVLYSHERVGIGFARFGCLKFRTMMLGADSCLQEYLGYHPAAAIEWGDSQKLSFDPRVTMIGRFLRQTSLDELPQLINVVRGEMSLVGPRPVTKTELTRYGPHGEAYASVRPGITGPWQISGRSDVDYARRVDLDTQYVLHRSFGRDTWILLCTPRAVLSRKGAR